MFPNYYPARKIIPKPDMGSSIQYYLDPDMSLAVRHILSIQGPPPYLISGPRCVCQRKTSSHEPRPSRTGLVIQEAVIQIYKASPASRLLICAPYNSACDVLMRGLLEVIPESDMFRANAAFREKEDVPDDILPSCLYVYETECFSCPSYIELASFRVIFSTFMSSIRLRNEGLLAGHFSHIFMVDASFATEPEAMVPLANFAIDNTAIVVSGQPRHSPSFARSKIARKHGLKISYFEGLLDYFAPLKSTSLSFITELSSDAEENFGYH